MKTFLLWVTLSTALNATMSQKAQARPKMSTKGLEKVGDSGEEFKSLTTIAPKLLEQPMTPRDLPTLLVKLMEEMRNIQNKKKEKEKYLGKTVPEQACKWMKVQEEECKMSIGAHCGPGLQLLKLKCECSKLAGFKECEESEKPKVSATPCQVPCKSHFTFLITMHLIIAALLVSAIAVLCWKRCRGIY